MSDARAVLGLDDLDKFLEAPSAEAPPVAGEADAAPSGEVEAYLHAAAVIDVFDPATLRPAGQAPGGVPGARVLEHLLPLAEPCVADASGTWSLGLVPRRKALATLATREAMLAAVAANRDRRTTPTQRMFEAVIEGAVPPLTDLPRAELAGLLTVADWLEDIIPVAIARAEVRVALDRADLLAPMRRLVAAGFVNREAQLTQVRQYVNESSSRVPLFVFGPGGMGKSTLLAQAILEHVESERGPFAFLDIDRPAIRPEHPLTFLQGALAQLRAPLQLDPSAAEAFEKELSHAVGRVEAGREMETVNASAGPWWFVNAFCSLVAPRLGPTQRLLLVVDTFEEAQYLGTEVVWSVLLLLRALIERLPAARVVIVGRALASGWEVHEANGTTFVTVDGASTTPGSPGFDAPIDLAPLDAAPARDLLRLELQRIEADPLTHDEAEAVLALVGTNPMCVKLGARVVAAEGGPARLREDGARRALFTKLKAEKLQALLYGRVLHHMHDPDVRKVAYPGLVVRRIDPDVIEHVLAGPCELVLGPTRTARTVFTAFANESALVEPAEGESVRHRPDVRRAMLADLTDHVRPELVARINRSAVTYYASCDDPISRAEELYHRLRLGQSRRVLDGRWLPAAAPYLKNAGEELQPRERLWLSEKTGTSLEPSIRAQADQESWEDQAARIAGRHLREGRAREALAVLGERADRRPRSRLYALEAEAQRFVGKPQAAADAAHRGVEALSRDGAVDEALMLQLTWASIEEARRAYDTALRLLETADAMSHHARDEMLRVRTAAALVRVHRHARPAEIDERRRLRSTLQALVTDEVLVRLRAHPVLLREVAGELAEDDARVAKAAIDTLGIEVKSKDQAEAFAETIATLATEDAGRVSNDKIFVDLEQHVRPGQVDADAVREQVTKNLSGADVKKVANWLGTAAAASRTLRVARDYFRAGVEQAIRGKGAS